MSESDSSNPTKPPPAADKLRPLTLTGDDFVELQPTDPAGPQVPPDEFVPSPQTLHDFRRDPRLLAQARRARGLWIVAAAVAVAGAAVGAAWLLR